MSDSDPVTVTATQGEVNYVRALAEREANEIQTHTKEVSEIVKIGQREYGERFDKASQALVDKLGDRVQQTMQVLRHSQEPHKHIMELGDDAARLEEFAKLSADAQRAEIAYRENRSAPFGRVTAAADPLWKSPVMKGEGMSDADWGSGKADRLTDKQFYAKR